MVEFWTGGEFRHAHERAAQDHIIRAFDQAFAGRTDVVLLVFNVFCNGKEMDMLMFKGDALAVIDLKDCDQPLKGTENGPWRVLNGDPLHGNPFRQVDGYRRALMQFLSKHRSEFLRPQKATHADFEYIAGIVAVSPSLHPQSEISVHSRHRWFHVTGVDRLHDLARNLSNDRFTFDETELRTLVRDVMGCNQITISHSARLAPRESKRLGGDAGAGEPPPTAVLPDRPIQSATNDRGATRRHLPSFPADLRKLQRTPRIALRDAVANMTEAQFFDLAKENALVRLILYEKNAILPNPGPGDDFQTQLWWGLTNDWRQVFLDCLSNDCPIIRINSLARIIGITSRTITDLIRQELGRPNCTHAMSLRCDELSDVLALLKSRHEIE